MKRRLVLTGGLAGMLAPLSGCALLGLPESETLNASVEESEHVTASDIQRSGDGTMRTQMSGDIHFDVSGAELLAALEPAWRRVAEYVFDMDDGFGNRTVRVTAHAADGSTAEPRDLLGAEYEDQFQPVAFSAFFDHYGLG